MSAPNIKQSIRCEKSSPGLWLLDRAGSFTTMERTMAINEHEGIAPDEVRSHARGRRFWAVLIAPWPIGVLVGLACSAIFGWGVAAGIGSGLAIALGLNFVWVVVVLAIDDGDVDDRVQEARIGPNAGRRQPARTTHWRE